MTELNRNQTSTDRIRSCSGMFLMLWYLVVNLADSLDTKNSSTHIFYKMRYQSTLGVQVLVISRRRQSMIMAQDGLAIGITMPPTAIWYKQYKNNVGLLADSRWTPPHALCIPQCIRSLMAMIMACCLLGARPLPEPIMLYYQSDPQE